MGATLTKKVREDIVQRTRAAIGEGIDWCEDKHSRWEENQKYTRGLQWSKADLERQERREKPAVPWNDTFKVVHAISNREMVSRLVPKVFGRNLADEGVANVLDEASRWQRQYSDSEHYESMGFRSASMCGYGVVHKYWDPLANDGDGMIRDRDVPLPEMLWPVRAREMNLSDRRWHVNGKWVDIDQAEEMWGDTNRSTSKMFRDMKARRGADDLMVDTSTQIDSSSPQSTAWGWGHVRARQFVNLAKNEVFVVEHEWLEVEYKFRAAVPVKFYEWVSFVSGGEPLNVESVDPQSGQPVVLPVEFERFDPLGPEEKAAFRDAVLAETEIKIFDTRKELNDFRDLYEDVIGEDFDLYSQFGLRSVKYAVLVNEEVVESGIRPYGFSYHFITGFPFESRDGMDFYGVVDLVKGQQDYKNALISNMLAIYMSNPKGLLMMEENAVADVNEFMDRVASPAGVVFVKQGTLSSGQERFKYLGAPAFPQGIGPLLQLAQEGVTATLGISPIDLNAQDDLRRVSGKVVQASQLASNVIVAILFDSMRKFRRSYGLCNLRFLRHMYDPGELIRIVGDEKAEDVPPDSAAWDDVLKFDIVIDEQPTTPSEQMELLQQLTVTGELTAMRNRGDITFEDQVKHFMPYMPQSTKREILKNRTIAEQKAMVEQQNQQLQTMIQQLYQHLQSVNGGDEILANFVASWQANQFSQQAFSQQGVPAQPQQPQAAPQ